VGIHSIVPTLQYLSHHRDCEQVRDFTIFVTVRVTVTVRDWTSIRVGVFGLLGLGCYV
jgi:hypothetical protein